MDAQLQATGMVSELRPGGDGFLHMEFMEMERIMAEVDAGSQGQYHTGSNDPYTCRVANTLATLECLDIAGASTLYASYSKNAVNQLYSSTDSNVLDEANNVLTITDFVLNVDVNLQGTGPATNPEDFFGIESSCSGSTSVNSSSGKRVGDGSINGFDLYVLLSAQFRRGLTQN